MHCGVMVTGANQGDRDRLPQGDYARPPTVSGRAQHEDTCSVGRWASRSAAIRAGQLAEQDRFGLLRCSRRSPALPGLLGGTPPVSPWARR